jgi:hypothetical protein
MDAKQLPSSVYPPANHIMIHSCKYSLVPNSTHKKFTTKIVEMEQSIISAYILEKSTPPWRTIWCDLNENFNTNTLKIACHLLMYSNASKKKTVEALSNHVFSKFPRSMDTFSIQRIVLQEVISHILM